MSDVDLGFPEPEEYEPVGSEDPGFEMDPLDHAEQRDVIELDDDREA